MNEQAIRDYMAIVNQTVEAIIAVPRREEMYYVVVSYTGPTTFSIKHYLVNVRDGVVASVDKATEGVVIYE